MKAFSQAQFLVSSAGPADLPPAGPPELAFVGRSNVGKSSAINALTGRKRLAFTSKTPGRTQMINFFELGAGAPPVGLPGYGDAKMPRGRRAGWLAPALWIFRATGTRKCRGRCAPVGGRSLARMSTRALRWRA